MKRAPVFITLLCLPALLAGQEPQPSLSVVRGTVVRAGNLAVTITPATVTRAVMNLADGK